MLDDSFGISARLDVLRMAGVQPGNAEPGGGLDEVSTRLAAKTVLIPVFLFGVLVLGAGGGVPPFRASSVVLYNHTGAVIPAVGWWPAVIPPPVLLSGWMIPGDGSRPRLESDIALEIATEPPTRWEGGRISPKGGYPLHCIYGPG